MCSLRPKLGTLWLVGAYHWSARQESCPLVVEVAQSSVAFHIRHMHVTSVGVGAGAETNKSVQMSNEEGDPWTDGLPIMQLNVNIDPS